MGRALRPALSGPSLLALVSLCGCSVPVAANLDEPNANQAVSLLDQGGVAADKERDPEHEGRYRISVLKADAAAAIGVLARENLPPEASPGVLEALGAGGVVPSRLAEQARLTVGVAGDLEHSLRTLDGVLSARVHLAIPEKDSLATDVPTDRPSASVLIRHRGATPPIAAGEVKRLVAGAVPNLAPEFVNVVMTPSLTAPASASTLSRLGPLTVSRGSSALLRLSALVVVGVNLSLLGVIYFLWARLRRLELTQMESKAVGTGPSGRPHK